MRSVAIKGVKEFEIKEIDEPVADGKNVILDVKKTGICGSDIHYWVAGNPVGLVMGHEFAGVVKDPGNREDLKVGDRVTALPISPCMECHACKSGNPQYCIHTWDKAVGLALTNPGGLAPQLSVRSDMVVKLPDSVSDEEAAMVEPTAVGYHAANLAKIEKGDKVLVVGGGIIGLVSAMFAKMQGADLVVVSETNKARGEKSVSLGVADEWMDATDPDFLAKVTEKTGRGFDRVIECCGNSPAVSSAIMATRTGGTVVLVGVSLEPVTVPLVMGVMHELTLQGAIAYTKEEFVSCVNMMADKEIEVTKFIDSIVGLEDVQASYEKLTSGVSDAVKIIVDPNK